MCLDPCSPGTTTLPKAGAFSRGNCECEARTSNSVLHTLLCTSMVTCAIAAAATRDWCQIWHWATWTVRYRGEEPCKLGPWKAQNKPTSDLTTER